MPHLCPQLLTEQNLIKGMAMNDSDVRDLGFPPEVEQ
jgi:hypothetical protein